MQPMFLLWMCFLWIASVPSERGDCERLGWRELEHARKSAYDAGKLARVLELANCEAILLGRLAAQPRGIEDADAPSPCDPLEVAFNICSERMPERHCAESSLAQFAAMGCRYDPTYAPTYYRSEAQFRIRRMDYRGALESLNRSIAVSEARFDVDDLDEPIEVSYDLLGAEAQRVELAAKLRSPDVFRTSLDEMEAQWHFIMRADCKTADDGAPDLSSLRYPVMAADALNLAAWGVLLAREAEMPAAVAEADRAIDMLLTALAIYTDGARPNPAKADNVRINLALAALQAGELHRAHAWLTSIDESRLLREELLWLRIVQVRAALAYGPGVRIDAWQREIESLATTVPGGAWHAAWTRGIVSEGQGRWSEAISAYFAAEAELEASGGDEPDVWPLDYGRQMFGESSRRLVTLLLASGDVYTASQVARASRNRAGRSVALDPCRGVDGYRGDAPPPGELRLLYFRGVRLAGETGDAPWFGFAITHNDVHAEVLSIPPPLPAMHRLPDDALEAWSTALLDPFRLEIERSSAIVVLASESLHEVPVHDLPWDDGILLAVAPVSYGLDLDVCTPAPHAVRPRALLISGNDPTFQREIDAVTKALQGQAFVLEHLQAGSAAELSAIDGPPHTVAHIIAHGDAESEPFAAGDSLRFSSTSTWRRAEILASSFAPNVVYLSACKASLADAETFGGGVSLAHTFLLRGTRFVIGPVGDLDGEATSAFASRFYPALAAIGIDGTPDAWRAAYLATRDAFRPGLLPYLRMLRLYSR